MENSLKRKAVSGVKWTSTSAVISSTIQLVQVAVLARFLDKADFGLMAMALFVIGISGIFIDMGISNALIYKQRVNKYQLSTLFWSNIILGILIYAIILSSSPYIAILYDTPELRSVINWVGITFLILPWGQQFDALLRRDMRFKTLAIRDILSKTVGLILAVVLAIKGYGVYALVYANLAGALVATSLLFVLGMKDYRPQFIFSYRSLKKKGFFSFGLFQMGEKSINYFNSNFDTLLIGKLLGMEALGVYNIAKTITVKPYQILNPIITKVAFPVFAKVQNEIDILKNAYLKVVSTLVSLNGPIYVLMILLARPIILVVFGDEWLEAVPILQILAVSYICNSIGNPVGALQLARGRADLGFYWNLGLFAILPLTIWVGSFYGLLGVALSLTIIKILISIAPAWYFFIRPLCNAGFKEYTIAYAKPVLIACLAAILPTILVCFISEIYVVILTIGSLYTLLYIVFSLKLNPSFMDEILRLIPVRLRMMLKIN